MDYDLSSFVKFFKIIKILKKRKTRQKIMAWMYHSIFLTILIKIFYDCEFFWNIRHSNFNLKFTKMKTIFLIFFCSLFSHFIPKKIIYNSISSKKKFIRDIFIQKKKGMVIHNGYKKFSNKKKTIKTLLFLL